jgi:hypothetical protein
VEIEENYDGFVASTKRKLSIISGEFKLLIKSEL